MVGFVARMEFESRGPILRMAELIHEQHPEVHLVLVGEGQLEPEIVRMVQRMKLGSCVHLAGLWKDTSQVYPAFDVLASTSRSEGMPLNVLEAMASGVPVAALAVGGVPDILANGITGLLAPPGDWTAIATAVSKLLERPIVRNEMGLQARKRAEQMFSLEATVRQTSDLFRRLVQPKALGSMPYVVSHPGQSWQPPQSLPQISRPSDSTS